jgi:hypothetical protein
MKWSLTGALGTVMALVAATQTHAATYDVLACGDALAGANHSWTVSNTTPAKLETGNECAATGGNGGLYARDAVDVSNATPQASAQWTFTAPPETRIVRLSSSRWIYKEDDDDWRPALMADEAPFETCAITYPAVACQLGAEGGQRSTVSFAPVQPLSVGVGCTAPTNSTCVNGALGHHAVEAVLYGATVTLSDSRTPTVSNVNGPLFASAYATGGQAATFDASDNTGIRSARLYVDGSPQTSTAYSCDFTYTVPCGNKSGAELSLDTRMLSDGSHSVQVGAVDAAGNETKSAGQSVIVDNAAPAAPAGLSVGGGSDWRSANSFGVFWTNPSDAGAPVAVAHYQLCASDGSGCQPPQQVVGTDVSRIDGLQVPSPGEWSLRIWLEDAAGNVDPTAIATTTLRYGTPPSGPTATQTTPTAPAPDTAATTAPMAPDLIDPTSTAVLTTPTAPLRNPRLRLTSVRMSRGGVVVRGSVATGAAARITITVRPKRGHAVRRTAVVHGGRFSVSLRAPGLHTLRGASVQALIHGNTVFQPASAILRARG